MTGDLCLWRPGEEPSVTLHADAGGNVPTRGEAVEITGENRKGPTVSALTSAENFVGTIVDVPADFDATETYAAGEEVGDVTVRVTHYVEWLEESATAVSPGDLVVMGADGARPYDGAGGDTALVVVGVCWQTHSDTEGTTGKVAVVRQKA